MSISAAQADAFFAEIQKHKAVWSIHDARGFPVPKNTDGVGVVPFWSLESRAQKIVTNIDTYKDFEVVPLTLDEWESKWLTGMEKDGFLAGLNWSGDRATGFDLAAAEVLARLHTAE